ncbi:S49 family peptidase [Tritonibacter mobilis]|uniref:S49 family peptidase n=1 Tax=Tritonibacter mobilis TaxID=379347 RepID=UPI0014020D4E|nr:S49 family peptidase [Tritonibacter mobilis]NHM19655.1 S49 family peptidase [Tritonibacter mobilis]NHM23804.1 S49 family peptidase [Tritonibacter mobilis]
MTEQPDIKQTAVAQAGPSLAQIAGRVLNRPLLLHPDKADLILHVLQGRIGIEPLQTVTPETNRFVGTYRRDNGGVGSMRVENGVAILPIVGSLVNRGAWIGASSGLVSYEGIAAQLREAEADPDVRAVLLDIDSPGGEATGMFAAAKLVSAVNKTKPVVAFVNDVAASAAYGIASAASKIIVSPTSMVGSIGVVLTHLDRSAELEDRGVKPTLIHAGAHKVDGHPFGPLSDAVRADLQAEVLKIYDQFVGLVAEGRTGRISADAIRATEARTYLGADAIAQGLADRMASLEEVIAALSQPPSGASPQRKGGPMTKTTQGQAPQDDVSAISPADLQAAVEAARTEAHAAGVIAGKAEATARIKSILTAPETEGREAQALVLALETEMTAVDASKVLAASPKANISASIADRAAQETELGAETPADQRNRSERNAAGWAKAITQANARFS